MVPDLDLLRLNMIRGITPRAAAVLLAHFGSAGAALRAGLGELRSLGELSPKLAARVADPPSVGEATKEVRRANRLGVIILSVGDDLYPERLLEIPDPPPVLYVRGQPLREETAVALVGARRASVYGRVQAERFAAGFVRAGVSVLSGLARGVDGVAHRAALEAGGRTIAILGSALDRMYPPEHAGLADDISRQGWVGSEHPFGTGPRAFHFPMRNRIIAGAAAATVVIEGRQKSGSLITARLAGEAGRLVFALPGRVDSELSRGPHALIRDGVILAEGPEHVLSDLGVTPIEAEDRPGPGDPLQERILEALDTSDPRRVDEILDALDADAPEILAALSTLELGGYVKALEGRRYVKR